jgi:hypothetical protein
VVELQPSKLDVAGSNPAARSIRTADRPGREGREAVTADAGDASGRTAAATGTASGTRRAGATLARTGSIEGTIAHVAQSAERVLGKDEVISSILIVGSNLAGVEEGQE